MYACISPVIKKFNIQPKEKNSLNHKFPCHRTTIVHGKKIRRVEKMFRVLNLQAVTHRNCVILIRFFFVFCLFLHKHLWIQAFCVQRVTNTLYIWNSKYVRNVSLPTASSSTCFTFFLTPPNAYLLHSLFSSIKDNGK